METAVCDEEGNTYPLQMADTRDLFLIPSIIQWATDTREALATISEPNRR